MSTPASSGSWHWLARLLIASDQRVAAVGYEVYVWQYMSPYACLQPLQERAGGMQRRQLSEQLQELSWLPWRWPT